MKKVNDTALIADYANGMSWKELQDKYSCSVTTVYDVLVRNNIKRTREEEKSWSKEQDDLFTQMYYSNCTYQEIGNAFNIKSSTITWHVHRLGLQMRGSGRNNTWENKFANNTIEANYWLGYIFADGHITNTSRSHRIVLYSGKEYVVLKYKDWFGNGVSIFSRPYTTQCGEMHYMYNASINSKQIADWFSATLNIASKKHHNLNPCIDITWDMIRGYFDGDGTCGHYRWGLKSCSKQWLLRIQTFLESYGIKSTVRLNTKDCYTLFVYDKTNLTLLLHYLYANPYYCHEYKYQNLVNLTKVISCSKSSELLEA